MSDVTRKVRAAYSSHTWRLTTLAVLCAVFCYLVLQVAAAPAPVQYEDDGDRVLLAFAADDASQLAGKLGGEAVFPVSIACDGETKVVMTTGGTVEKTLEEAGIVVGTNDRVTPGLQKNVKEFDEIVVVRREYQTRTEEEILPFETYYYYSPEVRAGTETIRVEGKEGLRVATYAQYTIGGGIVDEEVLENVEMVSEPVDREILMGFRSKPVSALDFEWTFDDNGEPADYKQVLRASQSAGYSAPVGAGTASGLPARVGHVAVNPNIIPYGSKLFIQSPDGKFVYGYAIAADTGTALMQNIVEVDLFYGTYAESAANGIREVDIFVLE